MTKLLTDQDLHVPYHEIHSWDRVSALLEPTTRIYVEEKVNGSNAAIVGHENAVHYQSRREVLDPNNAAQGYFKTFFEYAENQRQNDRFTHLDNKVFVGEVLNNNHKTKYTNAVPFVLFDVFDSIGALPQDNVKACADFLGCAHVPLLWEGTVEEFTQDVIDELLASKSAFGADVIEGIVIKTRNDVRDVHGNRLVGKIVNEKYKEKLRTPRIKKTLDEQLDELVEVLVTQARFDKAYQRGLEDGKDVYMHPHLMMGDLISDVHKEEADEIKEALYRLHEKKLNSKIAQKALTMRYEAT